MDTVTVTRLSAPALFYLMPNGSPVSARLRWCSAAPFEIEIAFRQPRGEDTIWVMGRDLVAEALAFGSSGEADVRFAPEPNDPDYLRMEVRSPNGTAVFVTPIVDLALFLERSYEELRDCDVPLVNDSEIEDLFFVYSWMIWGE